MKVVHTEKGFGLQQSETASRETRGFMLSINGLHNFYYLLEFHD